MCTYWAQSSSRLPIFLLKAQANYSNSTSYDASWGVYKHVTSFRSHVLFYSLQKFKVHLWWAPAQTYQSNLFKNAAECRIRGAFGQYSTYKNGLKQVKPSLESKFTFLRRCQQLILLSVLQCLAVLHSTRCHYFTIDCRHVFKWIAELTLNLPKPLFKPFSIWYEYHCLFQLVLTIHRLWERS